MNIVQMAAQMLTELPVLTAPPSRQAAIVYDRQHVALSTCYAMHCVRIQAAHSYWA